MTHKCPNGHKHGLTTTCYHDHGCRCDNCRNSLAARARARYRAKAYGTFQPAQVNPTGLIRRYQGLQVLGWTATQIAAEANLTHQRRLMTILRQKYIAPETHERFDAAYRRLVLRGRGPSKVTAARAVAKGWVSPLAWDDIDNDPAPANTPNFDPELIDEVRVQNAVDGRPGKRLTGAERRTAIRILHARKWTDNRIAHQLGCHEQTVFRIRGELGLTAFEYSEQVKQEAA